jgi:hypothetical protein
MVDKTSPAPPPDQLAAHEFLTELRTRITTQPLPYQYGVESRALESLWTLFEFGRNAIKNHPGCEVFARRVTDMLNVHVRPVTSKWHRALAEGRLESRDGAAAFRGDLAALQARLRRFAAELHELAYGHRGNDALTPPAVTQSELAATLADLRVGISGDGPLRPPNVDKINGVEAAAVHARRRHRNIGTADNMNAVGLALSGGGIRSATFCLGVVQVLAERGLMKDVDFLSTVSGGGYTGSFLTTRLGADQPMSDIAAPNGPDSDAIRYLRQHAKYLAAVDLKQRWSMATATVAGMLLNWSAPLLVILIAALAAIAYGEQHAFRVPWRQIVGVLGAITAVFVVVYGVGIRGRRRRASITGWIFAACAAMTLLAAGGWALEAGYRFAAAHSSSWLRLRTLTLGSGIVAAIPAILRFVPLATKPLARRIALQVALYACGVILPLGAIALFYGLTYAALHDKIAWQGLIAAAALCAAVALVVLNINLTGLHRLYRDQLARTFVQSAETRDESLRLRRINPKHTAPYHLINTTLNLPSSTAAALRERRSVFVVFSKYWCGSPTTVFVRTSSFRMNGENADLATAMAISGAAVAPHMGLGSKPALRALLTFLNIRLGFWLRQRNANGPFAVPGFLCLLREMTGIAMSEAHDWLYLSDGGHIENMGVYELLRRRCKYIICVDGESDPQSSFHGLMTLVRHAQIDFGVRVSFGLDDLRPAASGFSQTHWTLGRVRYPGGGQGLLLYLKLSVTGNEPELIRRYRLEHPEFPHQSTIDQFFDEEQFEAYRQLGVHVAEGLFTPALGTVTPASVPGWFRHLAVNLLHPESI